MRSIVDDLLDRIKEDFQGVLPPDATSEVIQMIGRLNAKWVPSNIIRAFERLQTFYGGSISTVILDEVASGKILTGEEVTVVYLNASNEWVFFRTREPQTRLTVSNGLPTWEGGPDPYLDEIRKAAFLGGFTPP